MEEKKSIIDSITSEPDPEQFFTAESPEESQRRQQDTERYVKKSMFKSSLQYIILIDLAIFFFGGLGITMVLLETSYLNENVVMIIGVIAVVIYIPFAFGRYIRYRIESNPSDLPQDAGWKTLIIVIMFVWIIVPMALIDIPVTIRKIQREKKNKGLDDLQKAALMVNLIGK